ncbi:MAG: CBS domain-containing protein [Deltaproteobacteria bacterium]|jgi:CBS domain-containing protein|nr:CBS domain-containing protein [Deltaproteobacteria bacterium]
MKTAGDIISDKPWGLISVSMDTLVYDVMQQMIAKKIGAILVGKEGAIVGIWTERDYFRNSIEPGFDAKKAVVGNYMNTELISVPPETPITALQDMFLGLFIRHILVKKENDYIGLLSMGDVMRAILLEKDEKIKRLNKMASWEYYENWGWHRKYDK